MFKHHSTDSLVLIWHSNWGNFAARVFVRVLGRLFYLPIVQICILLSMAFSPEARADNWLCGVGINMRSLEPRAAQNNDLVWRKVSELGVAAIDDLNAPEFKETKLRLTDLAFVPEYENAALSWMRSASRAGVEIAIASDRADYLGRHRAYVQSLSGGESGAPKMTSWSEQLLSQGLAMLLPQGRTDLTKLIAAENHAISQRSGIWSDRSPGRAYFVAADQGNTGLPRVHDAIGRFVLVEGILRAVEHQEWRTYLNFGSDWRRDFTIALEDDVRRRLAKDPSPDDAFSDWTGQKIRVRGIVENRGGPYIAVDNPDWLCLMTD